MVKTTMFERSRTRERFANGVPANRRGEAGADMKELLGREWRVIYSGNRPPLPLRLAKWAVFIVITRRLYG